MPFTERLERITGEFQRGRERFQLGAGFLWKPKWACSGLCDLGAHRVGQQGNKLRAETKWKRLVQETASPLVSQMTRKIKPKAPCLNSDIFMVFQIVLSRNKIGRCMVGDTRAA